MHETRSASSDDLATRTLPSGLACSTVCFRDRSLSAALASIEDLGFAAVDLAALAGLCEHIDPSGDPDRLAEASAALKASSLRPISINADPGSFNGKTLHEVVLARVDALSAFAADHEIPLIVLTCGEPERSEVDPGEQIRRVAEGVQDAHHVAAQYGVEIAVEAPHYFRLVNTLERAALLREQLDPNIAFVFDSSHVRAAGNDPARDFAAPFYAASTRLMHLRDAIPGDIRRVIGAGDIDFSALLLAAEAHGYAGDVVLELETHESPFATKDEEVQDAIVRLAPLFSITH